VVESRPSGTSIVDALAGKRIFLTGVTGFLGQVILERLLLDFPGATITVLVRSQTSATAVERVHYLTRKPAFDVLRQRWAIRKRRKSIRARYGSASWKVDRSSDPNQP
jgi:nucleoside-diphosphate-sugar epimerase